MLGGNLDGMVAGRGNPIWGAQHKSQHEVGAHQHARGFGRKPRSLTDAFDTCPQMLSESSQVHAARADPSIAARLSMWSSQRSDQHAPSSHRYSGQGETSKGPMREAPSAAFTGPRLTGAQGFNASTGCTGPTAASARIHSGPHKQQVHDLIH